MQALANSGSSLIKCLFLMPVFAWFACVHRFGGLSVGPRGACIRFCVIRGGGIRPSRLAQTTFRTLSDASSRSTLLFAFDRASSCHPPPRHCLLLPAPLFTQWLGPPIGICGGWPSIRRFSRRSRVCLGTSQLHRGIAPTYCHRLALVGTLLPAAAKPDPAEWAPLRGHIRVFFFRCFLYLNEG